MSTDKHVINNRNEIKGRTWWCDLRAWHIAYDWCPAWNAVGNMFLPSPPPLFFQHPATSSSIPFIGDMWHSVEILLHRKISACSDLPGGYLFSGRNGYAFRPKRPELDESVDPVLEKIVNPPLSFSFPLQERLFPFLGFSARNRESGQKTQCARQSQKIKFHCKKLKFEVIFLLKRQFCGEFYLFSREIRTFDFPNGLGPRIAIEPVGSVNDSAFLTVRSAPKRENVFVLSKSHSYRTRHDSEEYNENLWQKASYVDPGWASGETRLPSRLKNGSFLKQPRSQSFIWICATLKHFWKTFHHTILLNSK